MPKRWTEEEDELLKQHGGRMPAEKLVGFLQKRTGITRTIAAIQIRRNHLDPAWSADPVGYVPFYDVAGLGSDGKSYNDRAFRQATEAGALKVRYLGGRERMLVATWWADWWLVNCAREREEADRFLEEGWLTTAEVARLLGFTRRKATLILLHYAQRQGAYTMFANLQHQKLWDGRFVWEPTAMRAAVQLFQLKMMKVKPAGWWGIQRTSEELRVPARALRPTATWLRKLSFDEEVEMKVAGLGQGYWHPQQVRAFRVKYAEVLDERRRSYGMKSAAKRARRLA